MFDKLFGYGSMTRSRAIIEKSLAREGKLRETARMIRDLGERRNNMSRDDYSDEYTKLVRQLENLFD